MVHQELIAMPQQKPITITFQVVRPAIIIIKPAATVTTYTEGLTAPTGQAANTLILEVRSP